jgi:lipopolysaccharide transport system permease protein
VALPRIVPLLAWRDVSVRYKQTVIGVAWALMRPVTMVIFTLIFGRTAKLPSERPAPHALTLFTSMFDRRLRSAAQPCNGQDNGV